MESMSEGTVGVKGKDETLAELLARQAALEARRDQFRARLAELEQQQAARLARPATATPPPGGPCPEALQPAREGIIRVWVMTSTEGYRLSLVHLGPDGAGWAFRKWSDGTVYHLHQDDGHDILCDCPGCVRWGPRYAGGKGCKHARMLRALRQLVDPGL